MAVSHISTTSATGGSATASIAVDAAATLNRLIVMTVISTGGAAFTPPAGFSLTRYQTWWFGGRDIRVYQKIAGASESGTYDTAIPFSYWIVLQSIFDGIDTTTPVIDVNSAETFGMSFPSGNVTLPANGMLYGMWGGADSAVALTIDPAMTSRASGISSSNLLAYAATEAPGAGTYSRTGTTGGNEDYAAFLLALNPASAGGGVNSLDRDVLRGVMRGMR